MERNLTTPILAPIQVQAEDPEMNLKRRALIVGIDHYQQANMDLQAAVADARAMTTMLESHHGGAANYDCLLWADETDRKTPITRAALRHALHDLFSDFRGEALFYFSGHGTIGDTGGWLVTSDGAPDDWGISMEEVLGMALQSHVYDILLILDCCHSGDLGNPVALNTLSRPGDGRRTAALREDMTILAASLARESAIEGADHGLFTGAILSALAGGAADPMGWVTAPAIYTSIERRFGGWSQQPVYKSSATRVSVVRQCAPVVERTKLGLLRQLFASPDFQLQLDPDFEPEDEHGQMREPVHQEKVALGRLLKEYRDAGLLKTTVPGEMLFWTARLSHTVELSLRGREYWWLIENKRI